MVSLCRFQQYLILSVSFAIAKKIKRNHMKKLFSLLLPSILLMGCSGLKITSDYDSTVDFTQYKTYSFYGWVNDTDKDISVFDRKRIEKAFKDEFDSRHLTLVQEGGDIIVALYIVSNQKTKTSNVTVGVGYGGYGYGGYGGYHGYGPGWGWGGGYTSTSVNNYNYTEGTLVCDVYDAKAEQLIWEGVAVKDLDREVQDKNKMVQYAVSQMMQRYPIPAAKK